MWQQSFIWELNISNRLYFLIFIRASFVGRICGMVQGETDVIGAEQSGKQYNCDNYENQQPISQQHKKMVTRWQYVLPRRGGGGRGGGGRAVGGLGWGHWVCSLRACCSECGGGGLPLWSYVPYWSRQARSNPQWHWSLSLWHVISVSVFG